MTFGASTVSEFPGPSPRRRRDSSDGASQGNQVPARGVAATRPTERRKVHGGSKSTSKISARPPVRFQQLARLAEPRVRAVREDRGRFDREPRPLARRSRAPRAEAPPERRSRGAADQRDDNQTPRALLAPAVRPRDRLGGPRARVRRRVKRRGLRALVLMECSDGGLLGRSARRGDGFGVRGPARPRAAPRGRDRDRLCGHQPLGRPRTLHTKNRVRSAAPPRRAAARRVVVDAAVSGTASIGTASGTGQAAASSQICCVAALSEKHAISGSSDAIQ